MSAYVCGRAFLGILKRPHEVPRIISRDPHDSQGLDFLTVGCNRLSETKFVEVVFWMFISSRNFLGASIMGSLLGSRTVDSRNKECQSSE